MLFYLNIIGLLAVAIALIFWLVNPLKYKTRKRIIAAFVVFVGAVVLLVVVAFLSACIEWLVLNLLD